MFKVVPNGANRLDIEIDGKLDNDQMRVGLDELISRSESIEHGRMLYRISGFQLPTLGAIGVEMSRLPELFRLIGKF